MTIFDFIDNLKEYLDDWFNSRKGIAFKCNESPCFGEHTTKPNIYSHIVPSNEFKIGENEYRFPVNCPCILCHIISRNNDSYNIGISIAVKYESITQDEVVVPVENKFNCYEYMEASENYSPDAELEVYKSAMYLQDLVHKALVKSNFNISNLQFVLPDTQLFEWPYCFCQITFDTKIIEQNLSREYLLY